VPAKRRLRKVIPFECDHPLNGRQLITSPDSFRSVFITYSCKAHRSSLLSSVELCKFARAAHRLGTFADLVCFPCTFCTWEDFMNGIIYIVGLIVVVGFVLSLIGFHG
jgi:hypothetical protein